MSIDLERSLDDLARSVGDDALAERMNGHVYRMVAQVRRRRAARYTTTSVIGMSAAAAVVIAGVQLTGRGEGTAPVATDGPDATESPDGASLRCGATDIPDPADAPDETLVLIGEVGPTVAYGEDVPLSLDLMSANAQTFTIGSTTQIAVVADGVVVGNAEADSEGLGVLPGVDAAPDSAVTVVACAGDTPLNGGEYELVAWVTVTLHDGTVRRAVSDPLPFTIGANPLEEEAQDAAAQDRATQEALMTVAEMVASAPERADSFGVCGSVVPPTVDAPITVALNFDEPSYGSGRSFTAQVDVRATTAFPAEAQLTANNPQVVLTRDGIVVAVGDPTIREGTVNAVPIDLATDGTGTVAAPAWFGLCSLPGADAPELDLPAGTYQAYAVLTLTVDETGVDGTQSVPWEPVVIRSEPVDVTLG